jgi:hypothetical protein
MPTAAKHQIWDQAGSARELDRLMAEGRQFSAEYPQFLANHLPMVLVALQRLGAGDDRLREFFATYRDTNHLVPMPKAVAPIERARWTSALGERSRERDYREFFTREVDRLGIRSAIATYIPTLTPAISASALHGFMRLAYGVLREDSPEVGAALGYWSATCLTLAPATGAEPVTDDPGEVLLRLKPIEEFRDVETELDLLWHFMRAMSTKPAFRPVVDWLAIGPNSLTRVAQASLALYAGSMDFCALHALTGSHWLRILWPFLPDPDLMLRYFWQAIAALYPKIGFPDVPTAETLEAWRRTRSPDWPEITAAAAKSDDEHDLSLAFSAWEEWKFYRDPLYRYVAARRLRLIA